MPRSVETRTPFAERLVRIRKIKGLTQRDLAKSAGISPRVVALYETTIKYPTADIVIRLAGALEVSLDQLMGRRPVKIKEGISRNAVKKAKMLEGLSPKEQKDALKYIEYLKSRRLVKGNK